MQKSIPSLKKKLQLIFNLFIRLRDEGQPCISCGEPKSYLQAGHYWSVRMYDSLRFDEDNVHGECPKCNAFDPCHLISYTENLKNRIGNQRYQELKMRAEDYKKNGYKWSRFELEELIVKYKQKVKELKSIRA